MLWAKALRSPAHHAGIKKLNTKKAEAIKGVQAVVTWKDVPRLVYGHLEALGIPGDEPLMAKDEVRYKGQPIAFVAAEDEETAQAAVEAIELDLDERPALFDVRKGADPDAPQIHQWGKLVPAFRGRDGRPPDPQGRHRRRVRQGRHDRQGGLPAGRDRAASARDAGRARRPGGERPADDLLLHAGAVLLDGRRRRAPGVAAEQAQVRRRDGRRRLRRQGRHGRGYAVRAPRPEVRPPGEVALDARGGVPLLLDPRPVAHGDRRRSHEGRWLLAARC